MSFLPIVPAPGLAGWHFLTRTRSAQQQVFAQSGQVQRDAEYFAKNIKKVIGSDQLIDDHRLLRVALGAFGLEGDIRSKAFLQKVLDGGTLASDSLANRLADKRYYNLAEAFGFDFVGTPNTQLPDFAAKIVGAYQERQFEVAVGAQRPDLRHALGFARDLAEVIARQTTDKGRWFALMGNPPLREMMQKALGLPKSFAGLDLDRQLDSFRQAAQRTFATSDLAQLSQPEKADEILRKFLVRTQLEATPSAAAGQIALSLLQAVRSSPFR